jgi:lysophospholipase L1-like esterase
MTFRRFAAFSFVVAALAAAAAPASASASRYVAIGDSIAGAQDSYVDRYAAQLGITDVHKVISFGTAAQVASSVLPSAVVLIDDPTDTTVVTVHLGGHDYLANNCPNGLNRPDCDFPDGLHAVLSRLRTALDADPGPEQFLVLAPYNPASGLGNATERAIDAGARGADGRIDSTAHGDDWGMTDVMGWLACRSGATLVDPWAAFKFGGRSLMADEVHPNAAGQAVLTALVGDPAAGGPTPGCPLTTPFADIGSDSGDGRAHGTVEPRLAAARWWFEYGPTAAYGRSTPVAQLKASAGPRAVAADLPWSASATRLHVRLVVENGVGRQASADGVVRKPPRPRLRALLSGRGRRSDVLAHGVPLRIFSTGTSVTVRGRLQSRGRDPLVLNRRVAWKAGATRNVRVALTTGGRRLVRRARRPRLALTLLARGPGGASRLVRLPVRLR